MGKRSPSFRRRGEGVRRMKRGGPSRAVGGEETFLIQLQGKRKSKKRSFATWAGRKNRKKEGGGL